MLFNEKLKKLRKENNLTQEELAEKINVSRQAITKWESGEGIPDIENLKQISILLCLARRVLVIRSWDGIARSQVGLRLQRHQKCLQPQQHWQLSVVLPLTHRLAVCQSPTRTQQPPLQGLLPTANSPQLPLLRRKRVVSLM